MTVKRMDNVGIVVEDIDAAIEFFTELGLELEGRAPIEGDWFRRGGGDTRGQSASRFRNAASPASEIWTHFGSGDAPAS